MEHDTPPTLWTCGHSTRPWDAFTALLMEAGIEVLVDVRRYAGSRQNPQFAPETMAVRLAEVGVRYDALPALGGRRKVQANSPNDAWRVAAFRGYADHMASEEYRIGRAALIATARTARTCILCAEAVWWRCHRRLIADDFTLHGWRVVHLLAPGRTAIHPLNPAAVLVSDEVRYPAETGAS